MNLFHPENFHPVTADGVRIEKGMRLWDKNLYEFTVASAYSEIGTHDVRITVTEEARPIHLIRWWNCYSTLELARAAKAESEKAQ